MRDIFAMCIFVSFVRVVYFICMFYVICSLFIIQNCGVLLFLVWPSFVCQSVNCSFARKLGLHRWHHHRCHRQVECALAHTHTNASWIPVSWDMGTWRYVAIHCTLLSLNCNTRLYATDSLIRSIVLWTNHHRYVYAHSRHISAWIRKWFSIQIRWFFLHFQISYDDADNFKPDLYLDCVGVSTSYKTHRSSSSTSFFIFWFCCCLLVFSVGWAWAIDWPALVRVICIQFKSNCSFCFFSLHSIQ